MSNVDKEFKRMKAEATRIMLDMECDAASVENFAMATTQEAEHPAKVADQAEPQRPASIEAILACVDVLCEAAWDAGYSAGTQSVSDADDEKYEEAKRAIKLAIEEYRASTFKSCESYIAERDRYRRERDEFALRAEKAQ